MEPHYLPEFRDIRGRWIAYGASAFVLAGIVFAFVHQVELKQDVRCEIVSPSEIKVQGESGLISAIYVQPPAHVEAGQPLFRLERDMTLASDGARHGAFNAQVRDEQRRAVVALYAQRRVDLESQVATARAEEASRRAELAGIDEQGDQNRQLADETQKKLDRLESVSDFVVADRIEQARAELHQSRIALAQSAERRQQTLAAITNLQNTQTALAAQSKELDASRARDLQDADARFEQTRRDATVSAPKAGTVTFSRLVQGSKLQPDDIAMVLVTDTSQPLRAELRISSRRRGFVREGQTVRLKFDAFPYAKFGTYEARIDSISRTTVSAAQPTAVDFGEDGMPQAPGDDYIAWVTLRGHTFEYGKQRFDILPGMQASASIVIERRTIAEWVLEPLFKIVRG
ncbi:HlyD family efflux transporter periplasmic adaptor subunit [Paraburkholderia adhaesiva]|uniref:HlyD family efflux transporter periplasmic adaptor subunit n=1 Tax=Paraburkholderia adhaesiva TaxID=2883244 RepID=UPI001F29CD69|nr:HlyD family efflux transporter periplasmic adaptor subunit [Paraburkholderia adhaesiva]